LFAIDLLGDASFMICWVIESFFLLCCSSGLPGATDDFPRRRPPWRPSAPALLRPGFGDLLVGRDLLRQRIVLLRPAVDAAARCAERRQVSNRSPDRTQKSQTLSTVLGRRALFTSAGRCRRGAACELVLRTISTMRSSARA